MQPSLALLLALTGIFVLCRLDSKPAASVSRALWIPSLWMLITASRMVGQWLNLSAVGSSAEVYADGSPVDRNIFLILIIGALLIVIKRRVTIARFVRNNRWFCVYLAYCCVSIAWSDFPVVSLKRYVKELGNLLMVMIVWTEKFPMQAIETLLRRCAYALVPLSIVLFKYYPDLGRSYSRWTGELSFTGVTNNKNSLGALCAVSGLGLTWMVLSSLRNGYSKANKKEAAVRVGMLITTIWLLIKAHSATSIACFIVGLAILLGFRVRVIRRHAGTFLLFAALGAATMLVFGNALSVTTEALGRDDTLTGRTDVWKSAIGLGTNPIIGDGYSSFWLGERMEKMWEIYAWRPTEVHDGYLDIYLDLGIIGLILLAGVLFSAFGFMTRRLDKDFEEGVVRLAFMTMAVLYNITESAFRPGLLMYFMFTLVIVYVPRAVPAVPRQKSRRERASGNLSGLAENAEILTVSASHSCESMSSMPQTSRSRAALADGLA